MSPGKRSIAITSNKMPSPIRLFTLGEEPIIIHTRPGIVRAAAHVDIELVAAIGAAMVMNTALFTRLVVLVALVEAVMMVEGFVAQVVDVDVTEFSFWVGLIREVDDAVLDDVAFDAVDVIGFLPA